MRFAAAFLALLATACCLASNVRTDGGMLIVNEVSVLRTSTSEARAMAANLRGLDSLSLRVTSTKRSSKLFANGMLLATITRSEANDRGTTHKSLAAAWLTSIRNAWNLPPLRLSRSSLLLPLGGTASVSAVGELARSADWSTENPQVVSVSRSGASLIIKAKALGDTKIEVGEGGSTQTVTVRVLPYAANFPQSYGATVVGSPAGAASVKSVVEGVLKTRFQAVEGAKLVLGDFTANSIPPGEKRTFSIKVNADSPDAFRSDGTVNVTVTNLPVALRKETELWYCNEPENVRRPQNLFAATLKKDTPVRLLYHHINDSPQGLFIRVMVANESSQTASVVLIPGDSKDKNPVLAGVMAADPFFRGWLAGSGEVVTVPPKAALPIAFRRLAPQETSSGLCYIRLLPGGPSDLQVVAEAVAPYEIDARWQAAQRTPTPWREVGASMSMAPQFDPEYSDLIFPQPFKDEEFVYHAGGNFAFYRIGQKPIERREPGKPLDGNFGVIYNITARAENPTSNVADVELVYETSAGYSGGLFSIDGEVIRLPLMASKAEVRLARFKLEPGDSKSINVMTIPLSGSSYPATLVLRPISSLPDLIKK